VSAGDFSGIVAVAEWSDDEGDPCSSPGNALKKGPTG